jgi:hypothetical protein
MKRLLLNGSPRGKNSNSRLLISWFQEGLKLAGQQEAPVIDLADTRNVREQVNAFHEADEILLAMPLYADQAPGIVMHFFTWLVKDGSERVVGKKIYFIIQSGFMESMQSQALRDLLNRFCKRVGLINCGVAIKGGVEGIRMMPPRMQKKLRGWINESGLSMGQGKKIPQELINKMASPVRISKPLLFVIKMAIHTGIINFHWNAELKKHQAWEKRFDAPYAKP